MNKVKKLFFFIILAISNLYSAERSECSIYLKSIFNSKIDTQIEYHINSYIDSDIQKKKRIAFLDYSLNHLKQNGKFLSAQDYQKGIIKGATANDWKTVIGTLKASDNIPFFTSTYDYYLSFIKYASLHGEFIHSDLIKNIEIKRPKNKYSKEAKEYIELIKIKDEFSEKGPHFYTMILENEVIEQPTRTTAPISAAKNIIEEAIKNIERVNKIKANKKPKAKAQAKVETKIKDKVEVGTKAKIETQASTKIIKAQVNLEQIRSLKSKMKKSGAQYKFDTKTEAIASALLYFERNNTILSQLQLKSISSKSTTWIKLVGSGTYKNSSIKVFNNSASYYAHLVATMIKQNLNFESALQQSDFRLIAKGITEPEELKLFNAVKVFTNKINYKHEDTPLKKRVMLQIINDNLPIDLKITEKEYNIFYKKINNTSEPKTVIEKKNRSSKNVQLETKLNPSQTKEAITKTNDTTSKLKKKFKNINLEDLETEIFTPSKVITAPVKTNLQKSKRPGRVADLSTWTIKDKDHAIELWIDIFNENGRIIVLKDIQNKSYRNLKISDWNRLVGTKKVVGHVFFESKEDFFLTVIATIIDRKIELKKHHLQKLTRFIKDFENKSVNSIKDIVTLEYLKGNKEISDNDIDDIVSHLNSKIKNPTIKKQDIVELLTINSSPTNLKQANITVPTEIKPPANNTPEDVVKSLSRKLYSGEFSHISKRKKEAIFEALKISLLQPEGKFPNKESSRFINKYNLAQGKNEKLNNSNQFWVDARRVAESVNGLALTFYYQNIIVKNTEFSEDLREYALYDLAQEAMKWRQDRDMIRIKVSDFNSNIRSEEKLKDKLSVSYTRAVNKSKKIKSALFSKLKDLNTVSEYFASRKDVESRKRFINSMINGKSTSVIQTKEVKYIINEIEDWIVNGDFSDVETAILISDLMNSLKKSYADYSIIIPLEKELIQKINDEFELKFKNKKLDSLYELVISFSTIFPTRDEYIKEMNHKINILKFKQSPTDTTLEYASEFLIIKDDLSEAKLNLEENIFFHPGNIFHSLLKANSNYAISMASIKKSIAKRIQYIEGIDLLKVLDKNKLDEHKAIIKKIKNSIHLSINDISSFKQDHYNYIRVLSLYHKTLNVVIELGEMLDAGEITLNKKQYLKIIDIFNKEQTKLDSILNKDALLKVNDHSLKNLGIMTKLIEQAINNQNFSNIILKQLSKLN